MYHLACIPYNQPSQPSSFGLYDDQLEATFNREVGANFLEPGFGGDLSWNAWWVRQNILDAMKKWMKVRLQFQQTANANRILAYDREKVMAPGTLTEITKGLRD